jgi:cell wall-associated NlpC family hydrolase
MPANLSRFPDVFQILDLLGKPWSAGARGPEAYDCLGLAIEIQRRRGITGPKFLSCEGELHRQLATGGFLSDCEKLEAAEYGSVVLFKVGPYEHHLGTMVARYRMIHTTAQTRGVVVESILGPLWAHRIVGFYKIGEPGSGAIPDPWSPA